MRRRIPERYTVLIARTGKTPFTLSFKPITAAILLAIAIGGPLTWAGFTITTLIRSNSQLSERNQKLTDTANEVLLELDSLNADVEDLQERAGLEEGEPPASRSQPQSSQGGIGQTVEPETLFQLAQQRLPNLKGRLDGQIKPALEETLAEEQARASAYPNAIPLAGRFEVTSEFGLRRNPFGGFSFENHEGIDFVAAYGTPIYATAEGQVRLAENSNGYGNHVIIDHGYRHETLYAHMSELAVKVGDRVKRGQLVGYLGNTGRSSGPHLHYGVYRNGKAVNPRYYLKLEE